MLHVILSGLSFALIVLMAGLFLLAYAKKEGLGRLTKFVSYVAIIFGTVAFLGGITRVAMNGSCHKGMCDKNNTECSMMSNCDKGGDACPKKGHCDKGMENCPMKSHCDKDGDASMMGHCDKGNENCPKSSNGDMDGCKKDSLKKCCADKAAKK